MSSTHLTPIQSLLAWISEMSWEMVVEYLELYVEAESLDGRGGFQCLCSIGLAYFSGERKGRDGKGST